MAQDLTVAEVLDSKGWKLLFAPFGRENLHAQAVNGLVAMDPRSKTPLAKTLLHELIHIRRPLWSETKVRREESRLWNLATWREKAQLCKLLGKGRVWEGEEEFTEEPEVPVSDTSSS